MPLNKLRILLLEDLSSDAELIIRELKAASIFCDVLVVDSKEAYIKALQNVRPDIILSDHSVPFFSSMDALKLALDKCGKIPFILVTGTMSEEFAVEVLKEGAWDYIPKSQLQRLPDTILKAMAKFKYEKLRQKFLYDAILNEAYMQEAERIASYGSWELDVINSKLKLSKEGANILGCIQEDSAALFANILNIAHPEEAGHIRQVIRQILNTPDLKVYKDYFRLTDKDGLFRFIKTEFVLKHNLRGKLLRVNGFIQHASEPGESEEQSVEDNARFNCLAEGVRGAAVLSLNASGHITSSNTGARELLEFTDEEMKLKHISLFCTSEELLTGKLITHLKLRSGVPRLKTKGLLQTRNGSTVEGDILITSFNNPSGLVQGFIMIIYDIADCEIGFQRVEHMVH